MPGNVDEAKWNKAKEEARKEYKESDSAFWPVVQKIYDNMGGKRMSIEKEIEKRLHSAVLEGKIGSAEYQIKKEGDGYSLFVNGSKIIGPISYEDVKNTLVKHTKYMSAGDTKTKIQNYCQKAGVKNAMIKTNDKNFEISANDQDQLQHTEDLMENDSFITNTKIIKGDYGYKLIGSFKEVDGHRLSEEIKKDLSEGFANETTKPASDNAKFDSHQTDPARLSMDEKIEKKLKEFKQVYQVGNTKTNSFGDQEFTVSINGKNKEFVFHEGSHVNVEKFISDLRNKENK